MNFHSVGLAPAVQSLASLPASLPEELEAGRGRSGVDLEARLELLLPQELEVASTWARKSLRAAVKLLPKLQ
mgnify:CR=1 FL=1